MNNLSHDAGDTASSIHEVAAQSQVPLDVLLSLAVSLLRHRDEEIAALRARNAILENLLRHTADMIVPAGTVWQ